jgi:hypothetical protein
MAGSDENRSRSRRLGAEDRRWSSIDRVLGGRTIKRLGDVMYVTFIKPLVIIPMESLSFGFEQFILKVA